MSPFQTWLTNYSPLRQPETRRYFCGIGFSMIGIWIQMTALGLLVYQLSGGVASALGFSAFCNAIALISSSLLLSGIPDRFNRRIVLLIINIGQMCLALTMAALLHFHVATLWHVYVLSALLGASQAIYFPSHQTLLVDLVGLVEIRKAMGINSLVINVSRAAGPALAGWLVGAFGIEPAFWLNGATYLSVIITLISLRRVRCAPYAAKKGVGLIDALRVAAGHPVLRNTFLTALAMNALGLSCYLIVPALTQGHAEATGLLLGGAGFGSLLSALVVAPFATQWQRMGRVLTLSLLWMAAWLAVVAASPSLAFATFAMIMVGCATTLLFVGCTGLLQVLAPLAMRGRLMALFGIVWFGAQPLATLGLGTVADVIGANHAVLASAGLLFVCGLLLLADTPWRRWRLTSASK